MIILCLKKPIIFNAKYLNGYGEFGNHIGNLDVGQTKRMNCPICKGSKTFTITNVMGKIMWNCYKASCNVSGSKNVTMSADTIKKAMNQKNVIDYDTFEMPSNIVFGGVRQEVKAFAYEHGIAEHY